MQSSPSTCSFVCAYAWRIKINVSEKKNGKRENIFSSSLADKQGDTYKFVCTTHIHAHKRTKYISMRVLKV